MKRYVTGALVALSSATLVGCAGGPKVSELYDPAVEQEISAASQELNTLLESQYDILAPNSFASAKQNLEEAKQANMDKRDASIVRNEIQQARADMQRMQSVAQLGLPHLQEVLDARNAALEENAGAFPAFKEANEDLREVGERLEGGNVQYAVANRGSIQRGFIKAETLAVQENVLGDVRRALDIAEDKDAEDYIPDVYAAAQASLKNAEEVVAQNKDNPEAYAPAVEKANLLAARTKNLTDSSRWIEDSDAGTVAKWFESAMVNINRVVSSDSEVDIRAKDRVSQVNYITKTIAGETSETNRKVASLNQKVMSQEQLDARMAEVRQQFSPEEAEVLQQGDKVIIRVRGLNFAVGKADIPEQGRPLLEKLAATVTRFPASAVIVEGHTDSTGSPLLNERLSQQRAQAVNQYLQETANLNQDDVRAVGYGFRRPLTENRTAEGRAQNRRIDIVLDGAGNTEVKPTSQQ